jgi:hypothetical protein
VADDGGRPGPPPVGSVAEEAARLLDALGGWASTHGHAAREDVGDQEEDAADTSAQADANARADDEEASGQRAGHCPHCGAANGTRTALTCQWCPVCQGLGLLRSVRPETVDRLADLAGAMTVALRDIAAHGRRRHAAGTGGGAAAGSGAAPADGPGATRPPRVQDITIEDEDQGSATV